MVQCLLMLLITIYLYMSVTFASTISPLCDFVAATNIEFIYSSWSCAVTGQTTTDPCGNPGWHGITCVNNSVSKIMVVNVGLAGTLPSAIGSLVELQFFSVELNSLLGSIPSQLGSLTELTALEISNNFLTGSIPETLCSLEKLTMLILSDNDLTGRLPAHIASLTSLVEIFARQTFLTGTLPTGLAELVMLRTAVFDGSLLTGPLPSAFGSLSNLFLLSLLYNSLSGSLPASWGEFANIVSLDVGHNAITGSLPTSLDKLINLVYCYVEFNLLTGGLPAWLGQLPQLEEFNGNENRFTGPVPSHFGTDSTPCLIITLMLNGNALTGPFPAALGNCSRLQFLELGDTFVSGTIPCDIARVSGLEFLVAYGSALSGTLPSCLGSLTAMNGIMLTDNALTGTIVPEFGSMVYLQYLFLGDNALSGSLPPQLAALAHLQYLFVNDNLLTGPASRVDINNLTSLAYLDLSSNSLTGSLPANFTTTLATLDVSNNAAVTGTIPLGFGMSSTFHNLNISGSQIAGTIPSEFCSSNGASIDVSDTGIECYSGCLTSAAVLVYGASSDCHDGSILLEFLVIAGAVVGLVALFSVAYRLRLVVYRFLSGAVAGDKRTVEPEATAGVTKFRPLQGSVVVIITLLKLLLAVGIALGLTSWWRYGSAGANGDAVVESCTNPDVASCNSFCGDVVTVNVNVTDDDYQIDDQLIGTPLFTTSKHYSDIAYCVAEFRGECAYKYWLIFKLVPIMLHVLGFVLQCLTWRHYRDFTPQQRQYDTIISYLYPDLYDDDGGVAGKGYKNYRGMFDELMIRPFDSVFSFIEIMTVFYVWGELWFPPIYCDSVRPLSLYYYPILMTLLELTKFNVYACTRVAMHGHIGEAILILLNFELLVSNLWVTTRLACTYAAGVGVAICSHCLWSAQSVFFAIGGYSKDSARAWPQTQVDITINGADVEIATINPIATFATDTEMRNDN